MSLTLNIIILDSLRHNIDKRQIFSHKLLFYYFFVWKSDVPGDACIVREIAYRFLRIYKISEPTTYI